jgi:hypothetical protein
MLLLLLLLLSTAAPLPPAAAAAAKRPWKTGRASTADDSGSSPTTMGAECRRRAASNSCRLLSL